MYCRLQWEEGEQVLCVREGRLCKTHANIQFIQ